MHARIHLRYFERAIRFINVYHPFRFLKIVICGHFCLFAYVFWKFSLPLPGRPCALLHVFGPGAVLDTEALQVALAVAKPLVSLSFFAGPYFLCFGVGPDTAALS